MREALWPIRFQEPFPGPSSLSKGDTCRILGFELLHIQWISSCSDSAIEKHVHTICMTILEMSKRQQLSSREDFSNLFNSMKTQSVSVIIILISFQVNLEDQDLEADKLSWSSRLEARM